MFQMFARRAAALVVLAALSSPSLAGPAPKGDPDKKVICKVERGSTSRIATSRRCKTVADWEADRKRNQSVQADREDMLLRNPQDPSGSLGLTAEQRSAPN